MHAAENEHAGGDRQDQRQRTEIGLFDQQRNQRHRHAQWLEHRSPGRIHFIAEADEIAGEPHHIHQLHRFHHLERGHAEVEPTSRAIDGLADSGDEHKNQQYEAQHQQQAILLLDRLQFGTHQPARRADADDQEYQVLDQKIVRADIVALADRDRAGRHHHHAETGQCDRRTEQPRVVAAGQRVQARGLLAETEAREREPGRHQRIFNVARPTSTRITEMIQNRTITRGSGQPFNSK